MAAAPRDESSDNRRAPILSDLFSPVQREGLLFCTVVSRSHLNYAWTLREGLRRFHPTVPFCALVVDASASDEMPEEHFFDCPLVRLDAFSTPQTADMTIYYEAYEFCGNIKPAFLLHLFKETGARKIIYLDSDLFLTGPLWAALGRLETHDAIGVPHTLRPLPHDGYEPSDLTIGRSGVYNTGFMGFVKTTATLEMLAWMGERVHRLGFADHDLGMFCEQRFFNLGVTFLKERFSPILSDGYNVGYWNLLERTLSRRHGCWFANEERIAFFHMSGFDPRVPGRLSKYDGRHIGRLHPQAEILHELAADYVAQLRRVPFVPTRSYGHGTRDGVPITPVMRRHYHRYGTFKGVLSVEAALELARGYDGAGRLQEAEEVYAKIVRSVPTHMEALQGYALISLRLGKPENALDLFRRMLAIDPGHAEAKRHLGQS